MYNILVTKSVTEICATLCHFSFYFIGPLSLEFSITAMISAHIADYTNKMGEKKLFPISGSARDERLCSKIAVKWLVLWELAMFSDRIRATIEPGPSVYRSLAMLILYENAFKMFSYFFSPAFRNGGKKQPSSLSVY